MIGIAKRLRCTADVARSHDVVLGSSSVSGSTKGIVPPTLWYRYRTTASTHKPSIGPAHARKDGIGGVADGSGRLCSLTFSTRPR